MVLRYLARVNLWSPAATAMVVAEPANSSVGQMRVLPWCSVRAQPHCHGKSGANLFVLVLGSLLADQGTGSTTLIARTR